ncbi:MAG: hypothetical protein LBH20_02115 [Treponema sp.]|jgi:hypothetical protein|nr:hypothetical protein [Treponema sp.]
MSVTQTVEIPANHRLILDVPREVPAGPVILTFTPAKYGSNPRTAAPDRKPISKYFGILSPNVYGDGVAYQRNIRDEWDE